MFDVSLILLSQLISILPLIIGLWVLFDLIGGLLFGIK